MPNAALIEHNLTQFTQQIVELSAGVWGAVGFAARNMYVVEGKASLTNIDTTESANAAEISATARNTHIWQAKQLMQIEENG